MKKTILILAFFVILFAPPAFADKIDLYDVTIRVNEDSTKMSELKNKFYATFNKMKEEVVASITVKGFFAENPRKVRGR